MVGVKRRVGRFYLVWQSVRVRVFRTVVTVVCIAILIAILFSGTLVMGGVNRSIDLTQMRLGADLVVVPRGALAEYQEAVITGKFYTEQSLLTGTPFGFYMDRGIEEIVKSVPSVIHTSPQAYTATLPGSTCPCCYLPNIFIVGFDPETDFTINPWIRIHVNRTLGPDEVVTGANLLVPYLGYSFQIFGHNITVAGILEPTGTGVDMSVFVPLDTIYQIVEEAPGKTTHKVPELKRGQISAVLVKKNPDASYEKIAFDILARAQLQGIQVDIIEAAQLGREVREKMINVVTGTSMAVAIMWGLSVLFISSIFMLSVNERRREIGLLRSMGGTKNFIFGMIMSEATLLTILGGVLGVTIGGLSLHFFNDFIMNALGVPYIWPNIISMLKLIGLSLGLSVVTGAVAAFYPAALAGRMEPYESVRKGW